MTTDPIKDQLLDGLTKVAIKQKAKVRRRKRKSSFFTPLPESEHLQVEARKKLIAEQKPIEDPLFNQIRALSENYVSELPKRIDPDIDLVRNFILQEIQPLVLAINAGTVQAQEVLSMVGVSMDSTITSKLNVMLRRAVNYKLAQFLASMASIPQSKIGVLLHENPKVQESKPAGRSTKSVSSAARRTTAKSRDNTPKA